MDTNSTTVSALRGSRRAAKAIALMSVVGCLAVTGFAAAVTGAGAALSTQQHDLRYSSSRPSTSSWLIALQSCSSA